MVSGHRASRFTFEYAAAQRKLYFTDGSYWEMNAEISGTEQDSATLYPMKMQGYKCSYIVLAHKTGLSAPYANPSARISTIEDVRSLGPWNPVVQVTYNFGALTPADSLGILGPVASAVGIRISPGDVNLN